MKDEGIREREISKKTLAVKSYGLLIYLKIVCDIILLSV